MPRSRVPRLTAHVEALCEEAGLPPFDESKYDLLQDTVFFLWHDPPFCLGASTGASIYGMKSADLRGAWDRKFGA